MIEHTRLASTIPTHEAVSDAMFQPQIGIDKDVFCLGMRLCLLFGQWLADGKVRCDGDIESFDVNLGDDTSVVQIFIEYSRRDSRMRDDTSLEPDVS
jgi:hypothetical protein